MTTLSKDIPQLDILIHRGADEEFACRWTIDKRDGKGFVAKDISKWSATFTLNSQNETVYTLKCTTDKYGYAVANIPGSAFEADKWTNYLLGSWRIDAKGPNGERELLGWGHYEMV